MSIPRLHVDFPVIPRVKTPTIFGTSASGFMCPTTSLESNGRLKPPILMSTPTGLLDLYGPIAVVVEAVLYGVYLPLFSTSVRVILQQQETGSRPAKIFFWGSIVAFCLATAHIGLDVFRLVRATVHLDGSFYDPAKTSYPMIEYSINTAIVCVADFMVIYRCYLVWGNNLSVVLLPFILTVVNNILAGIVLAEYTKPSPGAWVGWTGTTLSCISLLQHAVTTGLIAWRIWRHQKQMDGIFGASSDPSTNLTRVIRIMVESAAIYLAALFLLIIFLIAGHRAAYIFLLAVVPCIGIAFSLLTIRLAAETTQPGSSVIISSGAPEWASSHRTDESRVWQARSGTYQMRSLMGDEEPHGLGQKIIPDQRLSDDIPANI
ncbi:hypothetical protein BD779DRAFT_412483 [Infundibulicybe gibba]|nr:hypothetical protein BD779DRAFT_412483 [Infundibulicybe gibba]